MKNLFAYGNLTRGEIFREVSGFSRTSTTATLKGYKRYSIAEQTYPAIVPFDTAIVEGTIYYAIPEKGFQELDRFEGELYERREVCIVTENGEQVGAEAYVFKEKYAYKLYKVEWDYRHFLERNKSTFQSTYSGFQYLK